MTVEVCIAMPVLAPVPSHLQPPRVGSLDLHGHHVSGAGDVGDEDGVEVTEAVQREPDPARLHTFDPAYSPQTNTERALHQLRPLNLHSTTFGL